MIIKVYKTVRPDFQPDIFDIDVWTLTVSTENSEIELRISEDHGKLRLSIDNQMIVEPSAANTINISRRDF